MSVFNKDYEDPHIFSYPPEFISSFSVLLVLFFRFLGGVFGRLRWCLIRGMNGVLIRSTLDHFGSTHQSDSPAHTLITVLEVI